jgi:septation ring formation regulator EzrA
MIIKEPLQIDYENDSVEAILEQIQYAIEQHPSHLKVLSKEEIEAQEKLNQLRKWDI